MRAAPSRRLVLRRAQDEVSLCALANAHRDGDGRVGLYAPLPGWQLLCWLNRSTIEQRVSEHNTGHYGGYTSSRRPVSLVFSEHFDRIEDAIAAERRIKGWRREKKEALAHGDFARLSNLARAYARKPHPSTGSG